MLSFRRRSTADKTVSSLSPWYYLDNIVCFGAVTVCAASFMAYSYMIAAFALFGGIFLAVRRLRGLYVRGTERSAVRKLVTGATRALVYAAAIITVMFPFAMRGSEDPRLYHLQRRVYTGNYKREDMSFLPWKVPEAAEGYRAEFVPSVLQAEGYVSISYYTSAERLEESERYALSRGAVKCPDENKYKYENIIKSRGEDIEKASVYVFPHEYREPIYFICRESGFFMVYR